MEDGATPKHRYRRDAAVRSGSENISKAERGDTGTRESLTSPHESAEKGHPHKEATRMIRAPVTPDLSGRIRDRRKWYPKRGKRSEGEGRRQS
jgi:hypothetical protein